MKNETNLFKRIRNIIVGNTLPKNEDLWIDTSNGEKNAVLKYKGNPLVGGSSGSGNGGGSTGITTIDKNTQPNIVWREPTAEDSEKFPSATVGTVADLPEGKLPILLVSKSVVQGVEQVEIMNIISITPPLDGVAGYISAGDGAEFLLSEDWTLLGVGIE